MPGLNSPDTWQGLVYDLIIGYCCHVSGLFKPGTLHPAVSQHHCPADTTRCRHNSIVFVLFVVCLKKGMKGIRGRGCQASEFSIDCCVFFDLTIEIV